MESIELKYQKHLENLRRASKKYNEKNRELVNERNRHYYSTKLSINKQYKEQKSEYNRKRYLEKKNRSLIVIPFPS